MQSTLNVTLAHLGRLSAERELLRNAALLLKARDVADGPRYPHLAARCFELEGEAQTFALFELAERRREIAHALDAAERVLGRAP
jgi:hypothetical protein